MTSVLFGDLVGFTTLSESRDPEEVRELLGRYFETAREVVGRYGGTIEKFIGDAVMAVWGVPTAHEDDAERAVRAGLDLIDAVAAFGESVGAPGLSMRVGVVTGEVAVTLGATDQGMVAGDAVNTAARVQTKAEPGTVWVDAQTRSLAAGSIDFADVGSHELKGKAEPVVLFAATAVRGLVGGERSSDRVQAPLVGRRRELSVLKEMFHVAAEEGRPRLVIVSGDAGVGKTRLGSEFYNYIDGLSATVLWHRGRCLAYGDGVAFSALTSAVRGRIGATDGDTEATTRAKLDAHLDTYVPEPVERSWLLPSLVSLLGLPGAGGQSREDLFSAWLTWFERLSGSAEAAVVWVVDDAQYADDGLLDFIEHLSTVAQVPMLIVLLTRPELLARRPELAALRRASMIGLETLSRGDIAGLLDSLVEGLPADARDALIERAEGNPLYAIETVRAMNDQGLTAGGPTRKPGAVRLATGVDAAALAALAAPASLQVLVASRLDLLPAPERAVLATASVLGHTFSLAALAAISGRSDELPTVLRMLVGRDLLTTITDRLSSEEGQYAFVQTVVRTVAYQTQSRRDRLERHLAVVAYFESSADNDSELSTVIAQHLRDAVSLVGADDAQHAELVQRLGQWLQRSAERSVAVGAPAAAVRALDEALTLATDLAGQVRLRILAAEAALAAGALAQCIAYAHPIATGQLEADPVAVGEATVNAANAMRWSGQIEEAWTLLQPYLAGGALDGLPTLTAARLARQLAATLRDRGDHGEVPIWSERAVTLAEDTGDDREVAAALIDDATALILRGQSRVGVTLLDYAAAFARDHHLGAELGRALLNLLAFGINRDLAAALAAGEEAMSVIEQTGNTGMCWHTAVNQCTALTLAGRWDDVATILDRPLLRQRPPEKNQQAFVGLQTAIIAWARDESVDLDALEAMGVLGERDRPESIDDMCFAANQAMHARVRGDAAGLATAAQRTVDLAFTYNGLDDEFPKLWALSVSWLIETEDFATARKLLRPVTDVPPTRWSPLLTAQVLRLRGTLNSLDPRPADPADIADIETDLHTAISALDDVGAIPDRARTQAALGAWLTRRGRSADAAPHLATARDTFTDLRATAWLRDLDAALSLGAAG
ncbi:MAG: adenylate/guanylate cyclase domain-containing protein [Jatrophihabitans sp.]|uniref:adenylate/guanylate cyclase domain-containing protein n=1 Tax=Jatrophihabitans sp. TaxID=1932789 RepID=UPI00390EE216